MIIDFFLTLLSFPGKMTEKKLPIDLLKQKFAAARKRKLEENIYDIDPISDDEDGPGKTRILLLFFKSIIYTLNTIV